MVDDRGQTPELAVPPGESLREALENLGVSQSELASRMRRPVAKINEIVNGKTAISADTAVQLETALGTPASFWIRLQSQYDEAVARQRFEQRIASERTAAERFPYAEMANLAWVARTRKLEEKARNLAYFFGVVSLEQVEELATGAAYRRSLGSRVSKHALAAWLRRGEVLARRVETSPYSPGELVHALPRLRSLTLDGGGFFHRLQRECAEVGVAVVAVPHLKGTYANGATRWLSPIKPMVQLSLRYPWDDVFWFSFFHEIGHLLRHRKKNVWIDTDRMERSAEEEEADRFAADTLIPKTAYERFVGSRRRVSEADVRTFARQIGVSPGIVVGRLHFDRVLPRTHLNGLRRKFRFAVAGEQG